MKKPEPEPPGAPPAPTSMWTTAGLAAATAPETACEYASTRAPSAGGSDASLRSDAIMGQFIEPGAPLQMGAPARAHAAASARPAVDEERLVVGEERAAGRVPERRHHRRLVGDALEPVLALAAAPEHSRRPRGDPRGLSRAQDDPDRPHLLDQGVKLVRRELPPGGHDLGRGQAGEVVRPQVREVADVAEGFEED